MAQAFTRLDGDPNRLVGFLEDVERSIVIELMFQTCVLLTEGRGDSQEGEEGHDGEPDVFAELSASMTERTAPEDPALRRLLPDGARDDAERAAEFRKFTEAGLRSGKIANLETAMRVLERGFVDDDRAAALADGEYARADGQDPASHEDDEPVDGLDDGTREIIMTRDEARAMMMALTDVRLVLAERLGIHTDADSEVLTRAVESVDAPSSPEELMAAYYDFLTWLSESVTLAYMGQA